MLGALLVDYLALFVRVCRGAIVWIICLYTVELDHVSLGAHRFVLADLEGEARLAEPPVLSVLRQGSLSFAGLAPAETHTVVLRVRFHALSDSFFSVLFGLEPAEVSDLALVVLVADFSSLSIWLAHGLERPNLCMVAIEALKTVTVFVARIILVGANARLLAVSRFALASDGATAPWIQVLSQVTGVLASSNLLTLLNLRSVLIYKRK